MRIFPSVTSSSPAISRSSVDFPQPDGPTKTTNWPSSISSEISGMTVTPPKLFLTCSSVIEPIIVPLLNSAKGQASDQLLLAEPAHDQDRRDGQRRGGRELGQEQPLGRG